ncbi:MAG: 3-hydroxyisobutyrate dehydrogenase [Rhodospirillales bacterium CG15_BIG_FIL_POST_REV_8_21_14_020_66_15]|nr:MAG: 3-hydroxyisobutyrate dehydrogenase [Rhodospirillales bacterium CG15_BIG_FIL_POST_REV_8_21_14_020_66_15]
MTKIAFIGVGNMGNPMARNLLKAGHQVTAFDVVPDLLAKAAEAGATAASSAGEAVAGAEVVVTMLPAGKHVDQVYREGILGKAPKGALLIDCSTIDVATARAVHEAARAGGYAMVDAPVSGGVGGAEAATLTFMVGGSDDAVARARPVLENMGRTIVHCGGPGNGQAAKICNNMMLGIQMASVAEAFVLAEKLGLDAQRLFDVSSTASGQCWSLTTYCPVPGPVPTSPANRGYAPGFAAALMLKDMGLALQAAKASGADVAVAEKAASLYQDYADAGEAGKDFSGIINLIRARASAE